jgi:hypothetical protein
MLHAFAFTLMPNILLHQVQVYKIWSGCPNHIFSTTLFKGQPVSRSEFHFGGYLKIY